MKNIWKSSYKFETTDILLYVESLTRLREQNDRATKATATTTTTPKTIKKNFFKHINRQREKQQQQ